MHTLLVPVRNRHAEVNTQCQPQNDHDEHDDTQAPPLQLPCITSAFDTLGEVDIGSFGILDDVVGLFFGGFDGGFLDDDCFSEILEKLVEFYQSLFDLLDIVVAGADGSEDGGSCAGSVGFELFQ